MDQASSTKQTGASWPISMQMGLGFLVTASLFFFLGRWTNERSLALPPPDEYKGAVLDLNQASKAELRLIPGIGDALAERILGERQRRRFQRVDDLRRVSGIGPKTLERIRPHVFVTPEESFVSDDEEETPPPPVMPTSAPRSTGISVKAQQLKETINVNRASLTELQKLPGIGPKLSQRIVDERAKAEFKSIAELRRVSGIGPKTLEKIRPHITIE